MKSTIINNIKDLVTQIVIKGKIYIPRSYVSITAYYIVPAVLVAILIASNLNLLGNDIQAGLGSTALVLLLIILFVKPLSILFKEIGILRTISSFRRQLGVATLYFAMFHFILYITSLNGSVFRNIAQILSNKGPLQIGAIALIIIIILGLTSNTFSTRLLKRNWKRLHKLAYILLPIVLLHVALIKGEAEEIIQGIVILCVYIALQILVHIKKAKLTVK